MTDVEFPLHTAHTLLTTRVPSNGETATISPQARSPDAADLASSAPGAPSGRGNDRAGSPPPPGRRTSDRSRRVIELEDAPSWVRV